jgi:hypothetical protein
MSDLLPNINAFFPPVLSGHLAARLGESANAMRRACQLGVLLVLNGFIDKAETADGDLMRQLRLAMALAEAYPPKLTSVTEMLIILGGNNTPGSLMAQGEAMLTAVFEGDELRIVSAVSRHAGITPASAHALLELVSGVMPALLQQFALRQQPSADVAAVLLKARRKVQATLLAQLPDLAAVPGPLRTARYAAAGLGPKALLNGAALKSGLLVRWNMLLLALLALIGSKSGRAFVEARVARPGVSPQAQPAAPKATGQLSALLPKMKPASTAPLPGAC